MALFTPGISSGNALTQRHPHIHTALVHLLPSGILELGEGLAALPEQQGLLDFAAAQLSWVLLIFAVDDCSLGLVVPKVLPVV